MNKKLVFVLFLVIMLGMLSFLFGQTTVTIGTGTSTGRYPLNDYYVHSRSQSLFLQSEIGVSSGVLTKLRWFRNDTGANPNAIGTTEIWLTETSSSVLSGTTWITPGTLVATISNIDLGPGNAWLEIDIDDFEYFGNNLLVSVRTQNAPYTSPHSFWRYTSTTPSYRMLAGNSDSVNPPSVSTSYNRPNIQMDFEPLAVVDPPNPATSPNPAHEASGVSLTPILTWASGGGAPTSFDVYFGTSATPSFIGNQLGTSYDPGNLSYSTPYYWQIVPRNDNGEAQDCPVWSFTTMADPTIDAFPYMQNFDGTWVGTPAAPLGWTVINANSDGYTWRQANTYITPTPSLPYAAHGMGNTNDYLITPAIDLTNFDARIKWLDKVESASYVNSYKVLVSTTNTAIGSFIHDLGTFNCANTAWTEHIINLDAFANQTIYVAFYQFASASTYYGFGIDNLTIEEMPSQPAFAINPTSWDFGLVDLVAPASKVFTISNSGGAPLEISSIDITEGGDVFTITVGPDMTIPAGNSTNFTVEFAPLAVAPYTGTITIMDNTSAKITREVSLSGEGYTRPAGSTCDNPLPVTLPLEDFADDTAAYGDDYSSTWITPNSSYINGNDMVLQFTLDAASTVYGNLTATTGSYIGMFIMQQTPDPVTPAPVLRSATASGTSLTMTPVELQAGTYFVILSTWPSPQTFAFVLNMWAVPLPTDPVFSVSPASKDFAVVALNTSASQSFIVSNVGQGSFDVTEVSLIDNASGYYSLTDLNEYPRAVVPGNDMYVMVSYSPALEGTHTATLRITDNLSKEYHDVFITGQGSDATNYGGGDEASTAGGYYFANNITVMAPTSPTFSWVNNTTNVLPGTVSSGSLDDGYWGPIYMEGLEFLFYGNPYNEVYISTNGFISFGAGYTPWSNTAIPLAATPNNMICMFWDDLQYYPGISNVYYGGNASMFVITYENMGRTGGTYNPLFSVTAQVILYSDGKIKLQYLDVVGEHTPTIGIENSTGTKGIQYHFDGVGGPYGTGAKDGGIAVMFGTNPNTLPVELSSFAATLTADMFVNVAWVAASETNHLGYNVLRGETDMLGNAIQINQNVITEGTAVGTQVSYSYLDTEVEANGTYYYWLESLDLGGTSVMHGPVSILVNGEPGDPGTPPLPPTVTKLLSAYPNPFNPSTNIRYSLKEAGKVRIEIYNVKGQMIRTFETNHSQPGYYQIMWDGRDASGRAVSSGLYLYRMTSGHYRESRKMVLAK